MKLLNAHEIDIAARLLRDGEIVAFPTETVYGLGAPIFKPSSIEKIFLAKNRPSDNPLIAHISDFDQAERIARALPEAFFLLAEYFWPGPLTLVATKRPCVPLIASAGLDTIGLRMPAHPLALLLIDEVGEPLVAPSANLSGKPSATSAAHVLHDFEGSIGAVIDGGDCEIGLESTVLDLSSARPQILRPGAITKEAIEAVLGLSISCTINSDSSPRSPGMKYRHYAPEAPVSLFTSVEELEKKWCEGCLVLAPAGISLKCPYLPLLTTSIYAELRAADAKKCREVLIFCDESVLKNDALMNRLRKAAASKSS